MDRQFVLNILNTKGSLDVDICLILLKDYLKNKGTSKEKIDELMQYLINPFVLQELIPPVLEYYKVKYEILTLYKEERTIKCY